MPENGATTVSRSSSACAVSSCERAEASAERALSLWVVGEIPF
jgi:hypothetical protein